MTFRRITTSFLILPIALFNGFDSPTPTDAISQATKIPILAVGTFHMGCTTDTYTTPFNIHDAGRMEQTAELVEKLTAFRPTIIAVEYPYEWQRSLDEGYQAYLAGTRESKPCDGELVYVGYNAARKLGLKRVYGFDAKLDFPHHLMNDLATELQSQTYLDYMESDLLIWKTTTKEFVDAHTVTEIYSFLNQDAAQDELYNVNAALYTYVNTPNGFEGADMAAEFYKRNLRMFANLNKIPKTSEDRIMIICGAGHTPFLKEFISKSPIYKLEDVGPYLE